MSTLMNFEQFHALLLNAQDEVFNKSKSLFNSIDSYNTLSEGFIKEIQIQKNTYVLHYDHGQSGADYECLIHFGRIQVSNKAFDDMYIEGVLSCIMPHIWLDEDEDIIQSVLSQQTIDYFKNLGLKTKSLGFGEFTLGDQDNKDVFKSQKEWESIIFNAPSMASATVDAWISDMDIDDDNILLSFDSIKSIDQMKTIMPIILENICDYLVLQLRENLEMIQSHYHDSSVAMAKNKLRRRLEQLRIDQGDQVSN